MEGDNDFAVSCGHGNTLPIAAARLTATTVETAVRVEMHHTVAILAGAIRVHRQATQATFVARVFEKLEAAATRCARRHRDPLATG